MKTTKLVMLFITAFTFCFFLIRCEKQQMITIRVQGSTTIEPFMRKVSKEFQTNRNVTFEISAPGSRSGINALIDGKCDIAMSSMEILPEQAAEAREKGISVKPFLLGYDIIIPIVHPSNSVSDISFDDLKKVYRGELKNWADLGGGESAIDVVDRGHSSGTYNVWHHTVAPPEPAESLYTVKPSNSSVLAWVSEHPDAIGYVSAAYLNPEVKPLTLDGIAMTENDSLLSEYHLKRPLFLYVNEEKFDKNIKTFIIFLIINDRGRELLRDAGFFYNS